MCGLIGTIYTDNRSETYDRLNKAMQRITHRGPDDEGIESIRVGEGMYIAGHKRLSIIDLSEMGSQPMESSDGRYLLSYNGEIYNYKELRRELETLGYSFTSDSDTEVLLNSWRCWGKGCLQKLTGMFAFSIFDKESKTLTCVRDPFGIKPFFYSFAPHSFTYASEIPPLLDLMETTPSMNLQVSYDYLVYSEYDRGEETFFEGIKRLLPGEMMTIKTGEPVLQSEITRWWTPSIEENSSITFKDAADELRERFLQNIRLHLRSDVPLGAALSGGVDSSAVVCAMRYLEPEIPIHTFSYIADGANINEEKWIDLVNQHVNARANKCYVKPEDLGNDIESLIKLQAEPFGTTSIYAQYRVFQLVKECGITVCLDGQGADELLAGYDGYPEYKVESLINSGKFSDLITFAKSWPQVDQRSSSRIYRSVMKAMIPSPLWRKIRQMKHYRISSEWLDKKWLYNHGVITDGDSMLEENGHPTRKVMQRLRLDLTKEMIPRLLRYEDRNSMHWSIESRVPFLTTDLAEFVFSLPEHFLISNQGITKHIFREAMRDIVPEPILNRKDKIGFETPGKKLVTGFADDLDHIMEPLESLGFIRSNQCRKLISETALGKRPYTHEIWRLICFSRWVNLFNVRIG